MAINGKGTEVVIDGKVIKLSGYESEEYLQKLASYLNAKIAEYNRMESFKRQPSDMQSILLQLNIADDYFKTKAELDELSAELEAKDTEKNAQTTTQLHSSHASKVVLKILQARLQ